MKKFALILVVLAIPVAAFLHYNLQKHAIVEITSIEVRRVDTSSGDSGQTAKTRDMFLVFARDPETKEPRVFRNEDTGWSWPWYFKFNSADIQARAGAMGADREIAVITYYGWRVNLFSMFPNVLSVRPGTVDETIIPWFNITVISILLVTFALFYRTYSRIFARFGGKKAIRNA